jgi:flagellar biosynthesis regulator FlaF
VRDLTRIGARISRLSVPVVAGFNELTLFVEVGAHDAIAACCRCAQVRAAVRVVLVAVVAALTGSDDPIAANLGATAIAFIVRVVVAVITALAQSDHAVTAELRCAVVLTLVRFVVVAIVTSLKAFFALD